MLNDISANFSGNLDMQEKGNYSWDSFFSVNDHYVKVFPLNDESDKVARFNRGYPAIQKNDGSKVSRWIYGFEENGDKIAFLLKGYTSTAFIPASIDLRAAHFYAPIIVKGNAHLDISKFYSIEFRGGIVDILHPPSSAILYSQSVEKCDKNEYKNVRKIQFQEDDYFSRSFTIEVNSEVVEVLYSIDMNGLRHELHKIPDLRQGICSFMRFEFTEGKSLFDIEKYYDYAMSLFQFCTMRGNVGFDIRLYGKSSEVVGDSLHPMKVKFLDGYVDYADTELSTRNVFTLDCFGENLPNLFKVLVEEQSKPELRLLPRRNSEFGRHYHSDVVDMYAALELEYLLLSESEILSTNKSSLSNTDSSNELTKLKKAVICFVNQSNYSDDAKNRAKSLIGKLDVLKNEKPKFTDKVCAILNIFDEQLFCDTRSYRLQDLYGYVGAFVNFEFIRALKKFVEMRDSAAHSRMSWNNGTGIFPHLMILVYLSILYRAGYTVEGSKSILGLGDSSLMTE